MKTLTVILRFIPFYVSLLVVVLLLIYKPEGYGAVVGVFAFIYLIIVPIMFFVVRRAKDPRKQKLDDKRFAIPAREH
jgi:preprotein translocase subunit SecG